MTKGKALAGVAQAQAAAAAANDTEQAARNALEALQANILAGESTGDTIQDYLIVRFGVLDEGARVRYEGINDLLKDKAGELILVHRRVRHLIRHRFVGESDYGEQDLCYIAVLTGDALIFSFDGKNATCTLPIDRYADQECRMAITKGTLCEGGPHKIFITADFWEPPVSVSGLNSFGYDYRPMTLDIGDEAAFEWLRIHRFQICRSEAELNLLLERLGKLTLSPPEADGGSDV